MTALGEHKMGLTLRTGIQSTGELSRLNFVGMVANRASQGVTIGCGSVHLFSCLETPATPQVGSGRKGRAGKVPLQGFYEVIVVWVQEPANLNRIDPVMSSATLRFRFADDTVRGRLLTRHSAKQTILEKWGGNSRCPLLLF